MTVCHFLTMKIFMGTCKDHQTWHFPSDEGIPFMELPFCSLVMEFSTLKSYLCSICI